MLPACAQGVDMSGVESVTCGRRRHRFDRSGVSASGEDLDVADLATLMPRTERSDLVVPSPQ